MGLQPTTCKHSVQLIPVLPGTCLTLRNFMVQPRIVYIGLCANQNCAGVRPEKMQETWKNEESRQMWKKKKQNMEKEEHLW